MRDGNSMQYCSMVAVYISSLYKELLEEKEGEEGVSPVLPDCRTRHIILVVLKSKTAASTLIATPAYIYYSDG